MHTFWSHGFKFLTATTLTAALTACGGGGSSSDTTPEAFSFTALTDVAFASSSEPESVTIIDISTAVDVSITGGEYSIDGGAFTSAAGTLTEGQTLTIAVIADSEFSATSTATITVGSVSESFSVTTLAQDVSPESLTFTDVTEAEFNGTFTSETITITEINDTAAISIASDAGGEYQINGGDFVTTAGIVEEGDTVAVRLSSGETVGVTTEATLTVGDVSATFSVTTIADSVAPDMAIIFPTANTLTDGSTVTLRGNASDDFGPIDITVAITTDDGATTFSTETFTLTESNTQVDSWSYTVTLDTAKTNVLTVTASDTGDNNSESQVLTITQSDVSANFPANNDVVWGVPDIQHQLDLDLMQNRILIPGSKPEHSALMTIDIETGEREELLDPDAIPGVNRLGIALNEEANDVYIGGGDELYVTNLDVLDVEVRDLNELFSDVLFGLQFRQVGGVDFVSESQIFVNTAVFADDRLRFSSDLNFDINDFGVGGTPGGLDAVNLIADSENRRAFTVFRDDNSLNIKAQWTSFSGTLPENVFEDTESVLGGIGYLNGDVPNQLLYMVDPSSSELKKIDINLDNRLESGEPIISTITGPSIPELGANAVNTLQAFTFNRESEIGFAIDTKVVADETINSIVSLYIVDLTTGERLVLSRYVEPASVIVP